MRSMIFFAACALAGCAATSLPVPHARSTPSIKALIAQVREQPQDKALLARALMAGQVVVIPNPHTASLSLHRVDLNERSFIPVFSDRETFDEEAYGTGFEKRAAIIDGRELAALLKGNETVILNPGHQPAIEFTGAELKAAAGRL